MRDNLIHTTGAPGSNLAGLVKSRYSAKPASGGISLPPLLLATLLAAFAHTSWAVGNLGGVVIPENANVVSGTPQEFTFWSCPLDLNGNISLGPDGVPGTSDDLCQQVVANWSVQGPIGTLSHSVGTSTTLTPANLQPGETVSGAVVAETSLGTSSATVNVSGPTGSMFCFAGDGESDKRTFEFISSFGTRIAIDLTCVNGASAIADLNDHPVFGDMFQFDVDMVLRNRVKQARESFSRHPLDGSMEPLRLEQVHELKFGRGRDQDVVKVETELRELLK